MNHEGSIFHSGCAVSANVLFFAKEVEAVAQRSGANSSFLVLNSGDWHMYDESAAWPAIAMATIKPEGGTRTVVAVGPAGQYWEVAPQSLKEVMGIIGEAQRSIRGVRSVGDSLYLVGMGRLVMERVDVGQWHDMSPKGDQVKGQVVGFEDIGGFSTEEVYAVGWQGEIWWRNKLKWRQVDSPVSANLNSIACSVEGVVYIVGDNGVMLEGRHETWKVVDTGKSENLLDVAVYKQQVFVVTDFGIFRLSPSGRLVAEDNFVEDDRPSTCLHLLESPDAVFSMGPSDLFRLTDGSWERLV
ncbi:MAG: hypothetical protein WAR41_16755 [Azonexus sp.]